MGRWAVVKKLLGSARFLEPQGVNCAAALNRVATETARGRSCLFLSVDGVLQGVLPFSDRLRPESAAVVGAYGSAGNQDDRDDDRATIAWSRAP